MKINKVRVLFMCVFFETVSIVFQLGRSDPLRERERERAEPMICRNTWDGYIQMEIIQYIVSTI